MWRVQFALRLHRSEAEFGGAGKTDCILINKLESEMQVTDQRVIDVMGVSPRHCAVTPTDSQSRRSRLNYSRRTPA
jgi:hypothetical protein